MRIVYHILACFALCGIALEVEEMYGEPFDIPQPDELVFMGWLRGGELFRSGCCWYRGAGKIFYFQPGHKANRSLKNPYVLKILENAVQWAAPTNWRQNLGCRYIGPETTEEVYFAQKSDVPLRTAT